MEHANAAIFAKIERIVSILAALPNLDFWTANAAALHASEHQRAMQFMQPFPYFCGSDKFAAQEKIGSCKRKLVGFSGGGDLKKSLGHRRTYWRIVPWLCIPPFLQSWGKYDWMYGVYLFFGLVEVTNNPVVKVQRSITSTKTYKSAAKYSKDSSAMYPNGEYIHGLLYCPT
ncbi:hypothetical protein SELMODRAFT_419888 [Selaginella moellendorffii]|uniref:Uncharacterized protein n=1 Tax=Selaginella moellendorffii TaxID=88036 RepID=D8SAV4_SELML|nr:hypothetical protein SELMODRAFT_419888 [Selaginella moellendorffii]